jgi:hypothetical protein
LGRVDAFKIDGLRLFFNSHDHGPEHFHANKPGKWEIRVFFRLCDEKSELVFDYKLRFGAERSSGERKQILEYVLKHQDDLLIEWENKVCVKENY